MNVYSALGSKHDELQANNQSSPTPSTSSPIPGIASMFNNSQSNYVAGGSFSITTNNMVNGSSPLDLLHKRAAPNAILNAGGRADEVRCHPGTREEVLSRIEKWRDAQDSQTPPIFWLSGPAGAGKTAIVQTTAERCRAQGVPQANFFFFRADHSRNSLSPLVATLLHQIILLYPPLRDLVATVLATNPLILDAILEDQLMQLIVSPLRAIQQSSSSYLPPLLLIDGLDECEEKRSQRQILDAFDQILAKHQPCPFRLLVASRDEPQIQAAFNNISSQLLPLYLDNQYSPDRDIRVFVNDEFKRIRRTHPLAHTLGITWPLVKDIDDIVSKSSGQFIYASTVLRFIMDSSASPELSLTWVRGAAQFYGNSKSPFAHLDAMYTFILSRVDDQEALKDILHAHFLMAKYSLRDIDVGLITLLEAYNPKYTEAALHSCLANLTPIARYTNDFSILFHHASFPDYLLDQSRSNNYFVDIDVFNSETQPAVWMTLGNLERYTRPWDRVRELAHGGLIRLRKLPPGFLNTLTALGPWCFNSPSGTLRTKDLFENLYNLCSCDDDVTNYKRILRQWINDQRFRHTLQYMREPDDSEWPPCSRRYFTMAYIKRAVTTEPDGWMFHALRSGTESDIRETSLWLNDVLHCIHHKKYHGSIQEYNRLLQMWVSWAIWNDIPLDGVDDLPNIWWYIQRSKIEKWTASYLGFGSRPE